MLGNWAAGLLGLKGREADAYATSVVRAELAGPRDDHVIEKLKGDFRDSKVAVTDAELQAKLTHLAEKARTQIEKARPQVMSATGGQLQRSA